VIEEKSVAEMRMNDAFVRMNVSMVRMTGLDD